MAKEEKTDYVVWLSELSKKDLAIAGGKGASLAEMFNKKFPVPPAFIVTAQTFEKFISSIKEEINQVIDKTDVDNTKELNESSRKIRELIEKQEINKEMEQEILEAYGILGAERQDMRKENALKILDKTKEVFVAVRSSATTEDLASASFAGQQETFLNVKGKEELLKKIKKCFSSLYTPRAIYYREKRGFHHAKALLAVVVQKMINAEKSGVLFTKNPIRDDNNVSIEAVFGLGEGIVSGKINPDNYLVSPELEILEKKIADKKKALIKAESGTEETRLTEEKSKKQVLTDGEIKRLADYGLQIERYYNKPQDIEFAIENREIYIVQSRPITTSAKKTQELAGTAILIGLPASPGVASGKVKIIKSMEDLEKVEKGDILVTEMTNPDMVVTMQKSDAIVTDEGGATCFSGDTKVLTNKGFMTIKDAYELINDNQDLLLLSYDVKKMNPRWKKVLSAAKRKSKTIRISCSQTGRIEDNTIDLTPDHKMIIFNNRDLVKKQISDVLKNKEMVCLVDKLPENMRFNDYKKAYLLGALLSDGYHKITLHHTGNPRRGSVIFTQKEIPEKTEFVETVKSYFKEVFNEEFNRKEIFCSNSNIRGRKISGIATHFISNKLAPALEISKISQNLDIWTLGLDETSSLNFLAGLIDGDGSFFNNRLHIYVSKENILQGIILSCLNLGIFPQVTRNRNIYHVQILERMGDILGYTKRVKGIPHEKILGNKLFSAKQILGDIIDKVNWRGKIRPYVDGNLLIDSKKLNRIFELCDEKTKEEIIRIVKSDLRMQRIRKMNNLYEENVYNLEIEADNELDHNFVIFTKKYTPLLVSNSHAAIVSREMGIPCVVGTKSATQLLKEGQIITVDGTHGRIYEGEVGEEKKKEVLPIEKTKTKIKVILDLPDYAERAAKSGTDAVGLLRLEGIIASSGKHPLIFLAENRLDAYTKLLETGISKIAQHFSSIWIRSSDMRSDEFRNLQGSPKEQEVNPMLGFHGIRFSLKNLSILEAELQAVKNVAEKFPDKELGVMFPQVISVEDVIEAKKSFEKFKTKNIRFGIMVETPAACMIIEELCEEGIDFISLGTNDLTQYTLALDRGNENIQNFYNEMHPAVLALIERVIRICREKAVETSICGQAASKKEMAQFLVEKGIDSLSVNADAANEISRFVQELEQKQPEPTEKIEEPEEQEQVEQEEQEEEIEEKEIVEKTEEFPDTDIGIDVFKPPEETAEREEGETEEETEEEAEKTEETTEKEETTEEEIPVETEEEKAEVEEEETEVEEIPEEDQEVQEAVDEMQGKKDEEDIDIQEETEEKEQEDDEKLDIF